MQTPDPRWQKLLRNFGWFVLTLIVLIILLQALRSPVVLVALWLVGIIWGGVLAYRLSRLLFAPDDFEVSDERSQAYLDQARNYKVKLEHAIKDSAGTAGQNNLAQLSDQVGTLVEAIEDLAARISNLRHDDVIRRDLQSVPKAIKDLEKRLNGESDSAIRQQLERTLNNRHNQLESLTTLQNTIKRAEIQIESTLSQLGTIYSQVLTGQSTSHVADYSRLSADVEEEVQLLQDHLEALREVKLGSA